MVYMTLGCHIMGIISQENKMSYHAPAQKPTPTPDPLINLGETAADSKNQRNKQGFLASFLQGSRNRGGGFLAAALNNRQTTLGNSQV